MSKIVLTAFLERRNSSSLHADLVMTMPGAGLMFVGQKSSRLQTQSVQLCIEARNYNGMLLAWFHFVLLHSVSAVCVLTISCVHIQVQNREHTFFIVYPVRLNAFQIVEIVTPTPRRD